MGCFNFERVKVLIFKLFRRCFKPIGWDGDIRKLRKRLTKVYSFFCSKPTVWDGDENAFVRYTTCAMVFQAHCVGW